MMPARFYEEIIQSESLRLGDSPWGDPFAANMIDVDGVFLEDDRRDSGLRERRGQCAAADSSANYHHLGICVECHDAMIKHIDRDAVTEASSLAGEADSGSIGHQETKARSRAAPSPTRHGDC